MWRDIGVGHALLREVDGAMLFLCEEGGEASEELRG
jgi:hypothetical protein